MGKYVTDGVPMILTSAIPIENEYTLTLDNATIDDIKKIESDDYFVLHRVLVVPHGFSLWVRYKVGANLLTVINNPLWQLCNEYTIMKSYAGIIDIEQDPHYPATIKDIYPYSCKKGVKDLYEAELLSMNQVVIEQMMCEGYLIKRYEMVTRSKHEDYDIKESSVTVRFRANAYSSAIEKVQKYVDKSNKVGGK